MLHVPVYDKAELDKIGEGNVRIAETIMKVEDWIQSLKEDWGLVADNDSKSKVEE
jgi:hypothetical protein